MLQSTLPWAGCTMTHFSQQKKKRERENRKKKEICLKMQEYITWKNKSGGDSDTPHCVGSFHAAAGWK